MNLRAFAFLLVTAAAAAACGTSTRTTVVNPAPHAMRPRPPHTVELFTSGAPARPHVDVAVIEAEESSSFSLADTSDMLAALRERGARMGCDGVVLGGSSSRDPGLNDAETWLVENPKGRKGFYGTCIVYTDRAPSTAAR
ncbi:MAG TPA: hypothetical protein VFU21_31035 [Kofleriaceae bacterium]|nr:hypothetical protein [Kofleriaceae bacterium]